MTTEPIITLLVDENQIITERRNKLAAIRAAGVAFPNDFERKHLAANLHAEFGEKSHDELEALQIHVAVAGRMMLKRVMGKASFATVQDMSGRIQLFLSNDGVGEEAHTAFKHYDLGDILGVVGVLRRFCSTYTRHAANCNSHLRHNQPLATGGEPHQLRTRRSAS